MAKNARIVSRRDFVKAAAATGIALGAGADALAAETRQGGMIYRQLGRTGEKVSAIGLGGFHIGNPPEAEGIKIIGARSIAALPSWIIAGIIMTVKANGVWARRCAMDIATRLF